MIILELWIRRQDREQLRKIVDIKYQKGTFEDEDIEVIIGTTQYDEWEVLGQYKTKERALEVLDEIQYLLNNNFCYSKELSQYITCNNAIYEMPKD